MESDSTRSTIVRLADPDDLDAAAHVLAAAFAEYPWTRWSIPDDGYAERLERLQRLYLAHALEHGIVIVTEEVSAVAAFLPPDAPPPTEGQQQRISELLGERLASISNLSLPGSPAGAWILETVGVSPDLQGAGLGTAVTAAGLAMIDDRAETVSLETSHEPNVRLYRRLGFTTVATTTIPDGPVVYSMNRVLPTG